MKQPVTVELGEYRFDPETGELLGRDGQTKPLRAQSRQVLAVLAARPNEVVSKTELFDAVWSDVSVTDDKAIEAFQTLAKYEGILPALEPSHAFAHVMKVAPTLPKDHILVMNLCGRGDKDIFTIAEKLGVKIHGE